MVESEELLRVIWGTGVAARGSGMVLSTSLSERSSMGGEAILSWGEEMDLVTVLFAGGLRVRSWEWRRDGVTVPELPTVWSHGAAWMNLQRER